MANRLQLWRRIADIWFPEDIAKLKSAIPEISKLSDIQVQDMYSNWGEDVYCESWTDVSESSITEFRKWLLIDEVDRADMVYYD